MGDVPMDEAAEKGVLGAVLMEGTQLMPVLVGSLKVEADAFHVPKHRKVWEACMSLYEKKEGYIDFTTAASELGPELEAMGGPAYLDLLIESAASAALGEHYAGLLMDAYTRRRVILWARDVEVQAYSRDASAEALVGGLSDSARGLLVGGDVKVSNADLCDELIRDWEDAALRKGPTWKVGVPWNNGPKSLDFLLGGLEPGLTLIAARPSVGKTTFEACVSDYVAGTLNGHVARVTLDMTAKRLLQRSICRGAGVSAAKLKGGFATKAQIEKCRDAADFVKSLNEKINSKDRDIGIISSWIRMLHARDPLSLFTVDFAQLVGVSALGKYGHSDANARVGYVSGALKALSLDLEVPNLVLSQLSRSPKGQRKKEPELEDLRDSGSLEQDASKVMFLYMDEDIHALMEEAYKGVTAKIRPVWFHVMKNQDGEIGKLPFWFHAQYFKFEPAEKDFSDWDMMVETYGHSVNRGSS